MQTQRFADPCLNTQYNRNFCLNGERRLGLPWILHKQNRQGAPIERPVCEGGYRVFFSASSSQAAASASLHSTQ